MKLLKRLDGELRPVRWIAGVIVLIWYGGCFLLCLMVSPWLSLPCALMFGFAVWTVRHNAHNQYQYHDNE